MVLSYWIVAFGVVRLLRYFHLRTLSEKARRALRCRKQLTVVCHGSVENAKSSYLRTAWAYASFLYKAYSFMEADSRSDSASFSESHAPIGRPDEKRLRSDEAETTQG
jgi:hypothetical protein